MRYRPLQAQLAIYQGPEGYISLGALETSFLKQQANSQEIVFLEVAGQYGGNIEREGHS